MELMVFLVSMVLQINYTCFPLQTKNKFLVHQRGGYRLPKSCKFHVTIFQIHDVIDIRRPGFDILVIEF